MKKLMTEWRKYTQKINEGRGELSMVGSTTLPFSQNDENEDRQDRDLDAAIELMNSGEGDVDRGDERNRQNPRHRESESPRDPEREQRGQRPARKCRPPRPHG